MILAENGVAREVGKARKEAREGKHLMEADMVTIFEKQLVEVRTTG